VYDASSGSDIDSALFYCGFAATALACQSEMEIPTLILAIPGRIAET